MTCSAAASTAWPLGRFSTPDRRVGHAIDQLLAAAADSDLGPLAGEAMFTDMVAHCERASLAWPVHLTPMTMDEYRCGSVVAGPLFTSAEFPWPEHLGRWLEPLLQINLVELGNLRGKALGSGWLQVWMEAGGGMTRIVPAETVKHEPLAPVPSERAASYHQALTDPRDDAPGWLPGHAIIGFEAPYVDYGHNQLLTYADWMVEDAPFSPSPVLDAALALKIAIDSDMNWITSSHRAFGMVNESDLEASALPPVLFAIEPNPPQISDSSNGNDRMYLCYDLDDVRGPLFSVHGRCS